MTLRALIYATVSTESRRTRTCPAWMSKSARIAGRVKLMPGVCLGRYGWRIGLGA